jgi:hypothetical protein
MRRSAAGREVESYVDDAGLRDRVDALIVPTSLVAPLIGHHADF